MHADVLMGLDVQAQTAEIGGDWQFPAVTFGQDDQQDPLWATKIEELIEGGPNGAAGEQDIIDQDDVSTVDTNGQLRGPHLRVHPDPGEVVSVKGDIQTPEGVREAELDLELFRHPNATGVDPDHQGIPQRTGLYPLAQVIAEARQ
jgi:hypothetical protein